MLLILPTETYILPLTTGTLIVVVPLPSASALVDLATPVRYQPLPRMKLPDTFPLATTLPVEVIP